MSYFNINRVVLVGRLTREPELREKPNFFDVDVYGAAAESVSNYMHRGSRVGVDGRLEWREWETAEQQKRQAVSIVADTVQFLDTRADRDSDGGGDPAGDDGELAGVGAEEKDLAF